jgi:hypothetical protein
MIVSSSISSGEPSQDQLHDGRDALLIDRVDR